MSANVERMMFLGETPWHGLGEKVDESVIYNVNESIDKSGLNWPVRMEPLVTVLDAQRSVDASLFSDPLETIIEPNVPNRAVVRESDGSILGVVGPRYVPLQNRAAFDWFQPFLDSRECAIHTAGSLDSGKKVWILAQLQQDNSTIVKNDEVAKFVLLSNSHDGTTSIRVGFTPVRVVCANTLAMAHNNAGSRMMRIRHSKNSAANLDQIRDIMNLANQEFETNAEKFRFLASRNFNQSDVKKFVKVMLGLDKVDIDDIPTRSKNIALGIENRIFDGENQKLPGVDGTWWAAYNGFNEYLNYESGRSNSNRLGSLWLGKGAGNNIKALEIALAMAG